MDLAEFLLARLAEDEAVARAAISAEPLYGEGEWIHQWVDDPWVGSSEEPWRFITRFDPARVVAKCEADRLIVEEHAEAIDDRFSSPGRPSGYCRMCVHPDGFPVKERTLGQRLPCRTLRLLALPYADHPGYREEWRVRPVVGPMGCGA